jgi:mannose-6-phosphate isomerase
MSQIRHVKKPWGFEIWWAHTDAYAGKLLQVERGHRLSLQYHQRKDESCYLLSGHVRLVKGPSIHELDERELGPGACWRNAPGEVHTVEALETSVLIEASTPELDDVVRLMDDYDRSADVVAHSAKTPVPPPRMVDKEQLAAKLELRRTELPPVVTKPGFPEPAAYFRGRMLWEESAVDAWLHRPQAVEVAPATMTDSHGRPFQPDETLVPPPARTTQSARARARRVHPPSGAMKRLVLSGISLGSRRK